MTDQPTHGVLATPHAYEEVHYDILAISVTEHDRLMAEQAAETEVWRRRAEQTATTRNQLNNQVDVEMDRAIKAERAAQALRAENVALRKVADAVRDYCAGNVSVSPWRVLAALDATNTGDGT